MKINIPIGLLSLLFVLSASVQLKAQTAPVVQMLEGGTFVGISGPLGCYRGGSNAVGPMFGLDMRYNFEKTPYDVGILFSFEMADRKYHLPECEMGRTQRNRVLFFGLIGDYNFRQSRKINPFIGIGIGMAHIDNVWSNVYPLHATVKPSFMLQGGVEVFYHIRLTAHLQFCRKGYNTMGLTFGFNIGGRPKKTQFHKKCDH
ncbi:hypothetical protein [Xylanibacter muris]|jgi:hypothetical protein|uniref:hypothetical protein n=1 Tax=Xylanibacter muris TaxID=2736290 RepID=UPI000FFE4B30|nr:hypothetical protein [Xylanibacter muris]RXE74597.1 hypothetical protein ED551_02885 [Muribaculaceae bacterium Isolate-013 (NCI)]